MDPVETNGSSGDHGSLHDGVWPVINGPVDEPATEANYTAEEQKIVDAVKELVEDRVRPQLLDDGGDVAFKSYDPEDGTIVLEMDSSG